MKSGGFHGWNLADFMAVEASKFNDRDRRAILRF